jgi:hypothetical protein
MDPEAHVPWTRDLGRPATIARFSSRPLPAIPKFSIAPSAHTMAVGAKKKFQLYGLLPTETIAKDLTKVATWTVDNAAIVKVLDPKTGEVQAMGPGTATVTATDNGLRTTVSVLVVPAELTKITVTPGSLNIANVGGRGALTAVGTIDTTPPLTIDITQNVVWTSGNPPAVTVAAGAVRGLSMGMTTIQAVVGSLASNAVPVSVAIPMGDGGMGDGGMGDGGMREGGMGDGGMGGEGGAPDAGVADGAQDCGCPDAADVDAPPAADAMPSTGDAMLGHD